MSHERVPGLKQLHIVCNMNDDAAHEVVETDNANYVNDDAGNHGIVGSTWPFR